MEAGMDVTSDEIRRHLEEAGDDYGRLASLIGKLNLWKEGSDFPTTARDAKCFIQRILEVDENMTRDRLQNLERSIRLLIPTLANGREVELQTSNLYVRTMEILKSPDVSIFLKCLLDMHMSDYNDVLNKRCAALESAEVRILVTGETCAGKSSLMNVLMAGNYLPVDHGKCTRITCELKDSIYRQAYIYYEKRLYPTNLELTIDAETPVWNRVKECIKSGYDPQEYEEGDQIKSVEKVVILWPILHMKECPCIQATFVDSPGFGGDEKSFSYLKLMALSCDGYIFVINNASHHGVEKDRVQKMMDILQNNAELDGTNLNPSSTYFICNKWDMVPSARKESLKTEILHQLQHIWLGITEEHIFRFSATQALKVITAGEPSEQYCDFMRYVCNVVENAVQLKKENHCLQLMIKANTAEGGEFPPVVRYFGSMYSATDDVYELILVMELCDTDLHKQIEKGVLSPSNVATAVRFPGAALRTTPCAIFLKSKSCALDIAIQAAKGLCFVHENGIVHRDVKPSNLLMSFRANRVFVKLTDVGVSKEYNIITTCGQNIGTLLYHSPEIRLSPLTNHSPACDVYSFGLVLWEVWYGRHVFSEIPSSQLEKHIALNTPDFKEYYPPAELKDLIKACWNKTPTVRPDMKTILQKLTKLAA